MEKYSRVVSVSGRTFRTSETMCDIFLAHASDIIARGDMELVPLLHEGGVEMLLIGSISSITVTEVEPTTGPDITGPLPDLTSTAA